MDTKEILSQLENRFSKKISWYLFSPFYADTEGNISEDGVLLFNIDTRFHCYNQNIDTSFDAIDVLTIEHAKKENVMAFLSGGNSKLKCMGTLPAVFCDSVDVIELDNKRTVFLKIKGTQFKQMLKIAASKQKYSMEEYNRSRTQI